MEEKSTTPILDFYRSLADEPRGTQGQFVLWLSLRTGLKQTGVYNHLMAEKWSPIESEAILKGIQDGSWRNGGA